MKKFWKIFLLWVLLLPSAIVYAQNEFDKKLATNLLLLEPELQRLITDKEGEISDDFSFSMRKICKGLLDGECYIIEDFHIGMDSTIEKHLNNERLILVIDNHVPYRLKGFYFNDFPLYFKHCCEQRESQSVKEILSSLMFSCDEEDVQIDFECLYKAFRSKELNYDEHPCLESALHKLNVYIEWGVNDKYCVKKGGEPIGYRGTKNYTRKAPHKHQQVGK